MGFFDNLKQTLAEGRGKLLTEVSRFRNGTFLEGVIAAAVLISAADGNISSEEKKKICDYVSVSEDLKCFSTDEVIAAFRKIATSIPPSAGPKPSRRWASCAARKIRRAFWCAWPSSLP